MCLLSMKTIFLFFELKRFKPRDSKWILTIIHQVVCDFLDAKYIRFTFHFPNFNVHWFYKYEGLFLALL
jgi:hypothetical protein